MISSCATNNQGTNETAMSRYCKEAYDNLYNTYDNNSIGSSSSEQALALLFISSENIAKQDELKRLDEECK